MRVTIHYAPPLTLSAKWIVDNGRETAAFNTEQEARDFAVQRWRISYEQIIRVRNAAESIEGDR